MYRLHTESRTAYLRRIQPRKQSRSYNPLLLYICSVLRPYFPLYSATPRPQLYIILEFVGRNGGISLWFNKDPRTFLYKRLLRGDKIHFALSFSVRPYPLCLSKAQNILYTLTFPFLSALRNGEHGTF